MILYSMSDQTSNKNINFIAEYIINLSSFKLFYNKNEQSIKVTIYLFQIKKYNHEIFS